MNKHCLQFSSTLLSPAIVRCVFILLVGATAGCASRNFHPNTTEATTLPTGKMLRIATFNVSFFRKVQGQLKKDLAESNNTQANAVAEIIQRMNPDILLLNEFDFDDEGAGVKAFQKNYLAKAHGDAKPVVFPYVFIPKVNTGLASGFDLDGDGKVGGPGDAQGYADYPGEYGMVVLSKFPIVTDKIRTFQKFLRKDMPGALLPDNLKTPEPHDWYSQEALAVMRLSSKNHVDVPVQVGDKELHVLASHPVPPAFDGEEDRNGKRNHDEIRFWNDYITPTNADYIKDDTGRQGGLPDDATFVILGDLNSDPSDGDSLRAPLKALLNHPRASLPVTPRSAGALEQGKLQGGSNNSHSGDPAFDTAQFSAKGVGNLRIDHVIPSKPLSVKQAQVFWPLLKDPLFALIDKKISSDHRMVVIDVLWP